MTLASGGLAIVEPETRREVVDLEERSWLARHCRGDARAFPALMEAYRRPVYGYLVRSGVAPSDRDDLFQTVFLKIHAGAASYDAARPLAPWIFTIAANAVRDHFRARPVPAAAFAVHFASHAPDDPPPDPPDPNPGPERIAEARQTVAWLEGAIQELPLAQREVLLLASVVGLPQQEIAEALNMPVNTVKTQLRRARIALSERLVEREAGCEGESHDEL